MITKDVLRSYLPHRRPGVTSDEDWGQMTVLTEYRDLPIKGRVVMDVGGNIGAMAVRSALEGALRVYTYEPEPSNYDVLAKHIAPFSNVTGINAAVTLQPTGTPINLWLTNERTMGSCSTTEFRGRTPVQVRSVNFIEELDRIQPESIKMDCEGAEWELLVATLPECVKDVIAELHFTKKFWRTTDFPYTLDWMKRQGFELIKEPKDTGKNFHTLAHWRRS